MEEFSLGRPEGGRGRLMEGLSFHSFLQFFQKFFNWPGLWAASYNGGCPLNGSSTVYLQIVVSSFSVCFSKAQFSCLYPEQKQMN